MGDAEGEQGGEELLSAGTDMVGAGAGQGGRVDGKAMAVTGGSKEGAEGWRALSGHNLHIPRQALREILLTELQAEQVCLPKETCIAHKTVLYSLKRDH